MRIKRDNQPPLDFQPPDYEADFENLKDEHDKLRQSGSTLIEENKLLTKQIDALKSELDALKQNASQTKPLQKVEGSFMFYLICVILGRLAIYVFAEKWGTVAIGAGMVCNVVFAAGGWVILIFWAEASWDAMQWLMIPDLVLVVVSLIISASALSGGALLEGRLDFRAQSPELVAAFECAALLILGSPLFLNVTKAVMHFLNDPIGKLKEQFTWTEKKKSNAPSPTSGA